MSELIPSWLSWDENAIEEATKKENYYIYKTGVKDIQVKDRSFQEKSCIITKPIVIEGNIINVSLETTEEETENCSIEYYVSFQANPLTEDWRPIFPTNKSSVNNEKLFINHDIDKSLPLRFIPVSGSLILKEDNIQVSKDLWGYSSGENNISLKFKSNPLSIYTVSYNINEILSPKKIVVEEKFKNIKDYSENGVLGESFPNGADMQGSIFLSKTPYIDRELLEAGYSPVQVNLYGKMLISNGGSTFSTTNPLTPILDYTQTGAGSPVMFNKTDYLGGEEVQLSPYDPTWDPLLNEGNGSMRYPVFEYLHDGRQLIFTEPFNNFDIYSNNNILHGNGKLVVYYKYINLTFRMKIIMRNLSKRYDSLTPVLKDYSLIFEAEK